MVSAKIQTPKYSTAENFNVIFARDGATKIRIIKEISPPMKENTTPVPSAFAASPFFAIGAPSKQVAIEEEVPGIFNRIAEINPPDIPPI